MTTIHFYRAQRRLLLLGANMQRFTLQRGVDTHNLHLQCQAIDNLIVLQQRMRALRAEYRAAQSAQYDIH